MKSFNYYEPFMETNSHSISCVSYFFYYKGAVVILKIANKNRIEFIKILVLIVFFILFSCTPTIPANDASISINSLEYNFGELLYKGKAECKFEITNSGKTPLVIYNVKTSCGCTAVEWTKKPIMPGQSGKIKIDYDSSYGGVFTKTITVFYNGKNSPQELHIKGRVKYPEDMEEALE